MISKDVITMYGDQQIHILWTVIAVLLVVVFFLVFNSKRVVSVPILFNVKLLSERMNMLIYGLSVGPAVDGDVVKRVLTIEVNSELVETREFEPSATDLGEVGFVEGDNVNLALVDVDDAGNTSEPAFVRFVAVDTIPPSTPGAFGATLIREVVPTVDVEESDVTPVVEVVMPDPVDMDVPEPVVVDDSVVPPESAPSGDPDDPGPLTDPVPESPPSGDPVR